MSATDKILNRRTPDFYVGKVMHLTGTVVPQGYPEGYYIPTSYDAAAHTFAYHYCGPEMPEGEPVYNYDGTRRDLVAVPSTVVPGLATWIVWPLLYVALVALGFMVMVDAGGFMMLICSPILLIPFHTWWKNIEPVGATQAGLALLAVTTTERVTREHRSHIHDGR